MMHFGTYDDLIDFTFFSRFRHLDIQHVPDVFACIFSLRETRSDRHCLRSNLLDFGSFRTLRRDGGTSSRDGVIVMISLGGGCGGCSGRSRCGRIGSLWWESFGSGRGDSSWAEGRGGGCFSQFSCKRRLRW